jgi:hypothetical protein
MANEFDGDFTGFDAVSYDRYQAEREYEDSLDFGDFEPDFNMFTEGDGEFPADYDGDLQSHDAEFDADDDYFDEGELRDNYLDYDSDEGDGYYDYY